RAVNFRGIAIGNPLSFSNDEEGFQVLLRWMQSLQEAHNLNFPIIGMEPTGHYWLSISRWVSEKQFEVVLVNPHLVKKNKENRDNTPSKSDKRMLSSSQTWLKTATIRSFATRLKRLKSFVSYSQTETLSLRDSLVRRTKSIVGL